LNTVYVVVAAAWVGPDGRLAAPTASASAALPAVIQRTIDELRRIPFLLHIMLVLVTNCALRHW
jgi:hypothetical protein